jgi:DtxR family Mn-dependent transcriptional regulator
MTAIAPVYLSLSVLVVVLALAALLWPRCGLLARSRQGRESAGRVRREDALKHLCKTEAGGRRATLESVAGAVQLQPDETGALLRDMEQRGLLSFASGDLRLTSEGRSQGAQVIRAHRLWECHLAENTGIHETEWHAQAEHREHSMSPEEVDALSARLGHPTHDPHGDPIPSATGELAADAGQPLTTLAPGDEARVTHIEDEPASLYAQLAALNLRPGMRVKLHAKDKDRIRFEADGAAHELAPILAHQIEVLPLPEAEAADGVKTLADFKPGERATVLGLARSCRGPERRRLLDLGFVAGTAVKVEMISPSGEPTAYRVRGTVIALHREQARLVLANNAGEVTS